LLLFGPPRQPPAGPGQDEAKTLDSLQLCQLWQFEVYRVTGDPGQPIKGTTTKKDLKDKDNGRRALQKPNLLNNLLSLVLGTTDSGCGTVGVCVCVCVYMCVCCVLSWASLTSFDWKTTGDKFPNKTNAADTLKYEQITN